MYAVHTNYTSHLHLTCVCVLSVMLKGPPGPRAEKGAMGSSGFPGKDVSYQIDSTCMYSCIHIVFFVFYIIIMVG